MLDEITVSSSITLYSTVGVEVIIILTHVRYNIYPDGSQC